LNTVGVRPDGERFSTTGSRSAVTEKSANRSDDRDLEHAYPNSADVAWFLMVICVKEVCF
jgi:hypothetical protein